MLDLFFSSQARIDLIKLFILNPEARYYPRQIETILHIPYTAIRRELDNLEKAGFLKKEIVGNRSYYTALKEFILFNELKNIILKTVGIGDVLQKALQNVKGLDIAFIYGSYAGNGPTTHTSDIDLFVIGDMPPQTVQKAVSIIQDGLGREINQVVFTLAEIRKKIWEKNYFVMRVLKSKKVFLKGSEDGIRKLA